MSIYDMKIYVNIQSTYCHVLFVYKGPTRSAILYALNSVKYILLTWLSQSLFVLYKNCQLNSTVRKLCRSCKQIYYIFSREIPRFIHWKKGCQKCYFHRVKISYCDVTPCIVCSVLDLKDTCFETKENVLNIFYIF